MKITEIETTPLGVPGWQGDGFDGSYGNAPWIREPPRTGPVREERQ